MPPCTSHTVNQPKMIPHHTWCVHAYSDSALLQIIASCSISPHRSNNLSWDHSVFYDVLFMPINCKSIFSTLAAEYILDSLCGILQLPKELVYKTNSRKTSFLLSIQKCCLFILQDELFSLPNGCSLTLSSPEFLILG